MEGLSLAGGTIRYHAGDIDTRDYVVGSVDYVLAVSIVRFSTIR
jgi:hypothetical protein